jgi:hypothetical protein
MAIFNEVENARYNRMLQKLFGVKGTAPVRQLAGEIAASLPLFNGVENRYLESWDRFALAFNAVAAAGNQSAVRIRNPKGSNVIAVVEKFAFGSDTAQQPNVFQFRDDGTDLATIISTAGTGFDIRGRPNAALICSRQNTQVAAPLPASNDSIDNHFILASQPRDIVNDFDQQLVLVPGTGYQVVAGTVNTNLTFSVLWRERTLEDSER